MSHQPGEHQAEPERWHGIAGEREGGEPAILSFTAAHRLPDAEPESHRKVEQESAATEEDGSRQPFGQERRHRAAVFDRSAEIASEEAPKKAGKLSTDRLVQSVASSEHRDLTRRKRPVFTESGERVARSGAHEHEQQGHGDRKGDHRLPGPAQQPTVHLTGPADHSRNRIQDETGLILTSRNLRFTA